MNTIVCFKYKGKKIYMRITENIIQTRLELQCILFNNFGLSKEQCEKLSETLEYTTIINWKDEWNIV